MRIDRYLLLKKIGQGAVGSVWKARQDEPIERDVALKLIKPGMDTPEILRRFETERRVLATLDHPGIATIFGAGNTESGVPYYVMEWIDGLPITDYCETQNLSTEERLTLFKKVCAAVQHAHEKGVIHRDLKPSNILVNERQLKVIDFGIAGTIADKTGDASGIEIIGTPGYMSPEQVGGEGMIDERSDVYSLGALLYELLCGRPPFSKETLRTAGLLEIVRTIREDDPPRPSSIKKAAENDDLDWITLKALSKNPTKRYGSPSALLDDVERHLKREPITATGPGIGTRFGRILRRRPAVAIVTAICLLAVLTTALMTGLVHSDPLSFLVTSAANDGPGSLREAIQRAPFGATIRFDRSLDGATIFLNGEALTIERDLTIDALPNAGDTLTGITLDAAGGDIVVSLPKPYTTVKLSGLTFTGSTVIGVDSDGGTLAIYRCVFTKSQLEAASVRIGKNGGKLTMDSCFLSDNEGGAIGISSHEAETTLRNCTIANNHSVDFACIFVRGKFLMQHCTVAGNIAENGAILVDAQNRIDLEHCTIVENSAPRGGGIHLHGGAKLYLKNTIVAGNIATRSGPPDVFPAQVGTDILTGGGNFVGSNEGIDHESEFQPSVGSRLNFEQIGTKDAPIDPMLAPLGDYGGPVPTMPPLPGSPVIDAVPAAGGIDGDGDGTARPDIGAAEYVR